MGVVRWFKESARCGSGASRVLARGTAAGPSAAPPPAVVPLVKYQPLERPDADPSAPGIVELTGAGATYGAVRASLVRKAWAAMGDTTWRWIEGPVITAGEVIASGADFDPVPIEWVGSATVGPLGPDLPRLAVDLVPMAWAVMHGGFRFLHAYPTRELAEQWASQHDADTVVPLYPLPTSTGQVP